MARVLFAGASPDLALDVIRRLPGVHHVTVADAPSALDALAEGGWDALVISHELLEGTPEGVLAHARSTYGLVAMPVVAVVSPQTEPATVMRLVNDLKVGQLLFAPVDTPTLLEPLADALGILAEAPPEEKRPAVADGVLSGLWDRFQEATLKRVATLDAAVQAIGGAGLQGTPRREAEREAHKLRGALGTFGFPEGSRLAAEIEELLAGDEPLSVDHARLIAEQIVALRRELDQTPLGSEASPAKPHTDAIRRLLIVEDDDMLGDELAREANARGFEVARAIDAVQARHLLLNEHPDAVLLDLHLDPAAPDGRTLLADLATATPPVPAFVLTGSATLVDRLEAARLGSTSFIQKPVPASVVLDAVAQALQPPQGEAPRVLAVDDDAAILAAVEAHLTGRGVHVMTLGDPLNFWNALEAHQPDLVVLDVDMPFLTGLELCRVLRNDFRWRSTPVLFLTARMDPASIQRMFAAGADDYVPKPIIGPELTTRITNRLERVRLLRQLAAAEQALVSAQPPV